MYARTMNTTLTDSICKIFVARIKFSPSNFVATSLVNHGASKIQISASITEILKVNVKIFEIYFLSFF